MKHSIQPALQKHGAIKKFNFSIGVIAGGVAAVLGGQLLGYELAASLLPLLGDFSDSQQTLASYLIVQLLTIAMLIGMAGLFKASNVRIGLGGVKSWTYLLLLPLIYIACMMASVTATVIISLLVSSFDVSQVQDLGLDPLTRADVIATGILLVLVVPLAEEFIFRGYLFGLLRRELPFWLVAILTSVLFALAHGQWNVAVDTFILGIALSYLREKTGSIWTGVALHALKNAVAFTMLFVYNVV